MSRRLEYSALHVVYWLRDAAGDVIYIGRSSRFDDRLKEHASSSAFGPDVASVEKSNPMDRDSAVAYEAQAIFYERPRHNINGNPDRDHRLIAAARAAEFDAEAEIAGIVGARVFAQRHTEVDWRQLVGRRAR